MTRCSGMTHWPRVRRGFLSHWMTFSGVLMLVTCGGGAASSTGKIDLAGRGSPGAGGCSRAFAHAERLAGTIAAALCCSPFATGVCCWSYLWPR